jgi:hypothetical protein
LKTYAFDVIVNDTPYTVELALEAADHWDAEEQIRETICSKFSRDNGDFKGLAKQAVHQFVKEFAAALDAGRVQDVHEA